MGVNGKILLHVLNEHPSLWCLYEIWKLYSQGNKLVGQSTPFVEAAEYEPSGTSIRK